MLDQLTDAQDMARRFPKACFAPANRDIARVGAGAFVQVSRHDQRLWIEVTANADGVITGLLATPPDFDRNGDLTYRQAVTIAHCHIHQLLANP